MKGTFRDDPLDLDDIFEAGKYEGRKVLDVLASDIGHILHSIKYDVWHFSEAVKKLAKESV